MRRSSERILTTHVGSLIRPDPLLPFIRAKQNGQPYDAQAYRKCLASSVEDVVRRRTGLWLTPDRGRVAAAEVAAVLARRLGWDDARRRGEHKWITGGFPRPAFSKSHQPTLRRPCCLLGAGFAVVLVSLGKPRGGGAPRGVQPNFAPCGAGPQ